MSAPPRTFADRAAFRTWLERHHDRETELLVRCFKRHASDRGLTYPEAVDEALCWGWIDGVRRSLDEDSFSNRFSPRKAKSVWSAINIKRARELEAEGRMAPPGRSAFEARRSAAGVYSFESKPVDFPAAMKRRFRAAARRVCVLVGPAARLSPGRDVLGPVREAGGHARASARRRHRLLEAG